jgi:hypothetical protein
VEFCDYSKSQITDFLKYEPISRNIPVRFEPVLEHIPENVEFIRHDVQKRPAFQEFIYRRVSHRFKVLGRTPRQANFFNKRKYFNLFFRKRACYAKTIQQLHAGNTYPRGDEDNFEQELAPKPTLRVDASVQARGEPARRRIVTLDFGSPVSIMSEEELLRTAEEVRAIPRKTFGSVAAGGCVNADFAGAVKMRIGKTWRRHWFYGGQGVACGTRILGTGALCKHQVIPILHRGKVLFGGEVLPVRGMEKVASESDTRVQAIVLQRFQEAAVGEHLPEDEKEEVVGLVSGEREKGESERRYALKRWLVTRFADVFQTKRSKRSLQTVRGHEVDFKTKDGHALDQEGAQRVFRQAPAERRAMDETLKKHVDTGLLVPRKSKFASPGFIVFGKDASGKKLLHKHRLVGDYRKLNKITRRIHYALPRIDQLIADVGNGVFFSEFDFLSGFNQIAVSKRSADAFSLVMSQGCFSQTRMPQGWVNSSPFFQGCVDSDFVDMNAFLRQYIDDSTLYTEREGQSTVDVATELAGMFPEEEEWQQLVGDVLAERREQRACAKEGITVEEKDFSSPSKGVLNFSGLKSIKSVESAPHEGGAAKANPSTAKHNAPRDDTTEFLRHAHQVALFLNRCREQRYTISAEKAVLFKNRVTLLGFDLGPDGEVRVTKKRIRAFRMRPRPVISGKNFEEVERDDLWFAAQRSVGDGADSVGDNGSAVLGAKLEIDLKALRSLLGAAGYYRGLIADFAAVVAPMQRHLRSKKGDAEKEEVPVWEDEEENSFRHLLHLLSGSVICSPKEGCVKAVETDWSLDGMGAVLYQYVQEREDAPSLQDDDGKFEKNLFLKSPAKLEKLGWRKEPIAICSRALTEAESKFDPRSGEAAAIGLALRKFRCYLLGEEFVVVTDHSSLTWLHNSEVTQRMGRLACLLSEFDYTVLYKPGEQNVVPDHLSRFPPHHPDPGGDDEQHEDDLAAILHIDAGQRAPRKVDNTEETAKTMLHRGCKIAGCGTCAEAKLAKLRKEKQRSPPPHKECAFNIKVVADDLGSGEQKPSYWGNKFALVQRDLHTGWMHVVPSKTKCKQAHAKAIAQWEKENGRFAETRVEPGAEPIAVETTWRTDGGIHTAGRKQEVVEAHVHHKAGGAERAVRTVQEDDRALLIEAQHRIDFKDFPWMKKRGAAGLWDFGGRYAATLSNFCSYKKGDAPRKRRNLADTRKQLFPFAQSVVFQVPKRKKADRFERGGYARRGMFLGWSTFSGIGGGYVVLEAAGERRGRLVVTTAIRPVSKRPQ